MDIKNALGRKVGPLPMAAWAGIVLVIVVVVVMNRRSSTPDDVVDIGIDLGARNRARPMSASHAVTASPRNQAAMDNAEGFVDMGWFDEIADSVIQESVSDTNSNSWSPFGGSNETPTGGPAPSYVDTSLSNTYTRPVESKPPADVYYPPAPQDIQGPGSSVTSDADAAYIYNTNMAAAGYSWEPISQKWVK